METYCGFCDVGFNPAHQSVEDWLYIHFDGPRPSGREFS